MRTGVLDAFSSWLAHRMSAVSTNRAIFGEGVIGLLCKVERELLS